MTTYRATSVGILADLDHGEGWIYFKWPDPLYGWDGLHIELDGFCSRRRSILSGNGPPKFVDIQNDRLTLRFSPRLAKRLELEEEIEIHFEISEADLRELREIAKYLDFTESK